MSCWMVSNYHIAALIGSYMALLARDPHKGHTQVSDDDAEDMAKKLYKQNLRSTDERYAHNVDALADFTTQYAANPVTLAQMNAWKRQPLKPGEFFKALNCYEYQANETDDWPQTDAYKLCDDMRRAFCREVEGYEETPWGIDNPPPVRPDIRADGLRKRFAK